MSVQISSTKSLSIASVFGFLTGAIGIFSSPQAAAILPAKVSAVVTIAGLVITTLAKALVHDTGK